MKRRMDTPQLKIIMRSHPKLMIIKTMSRLSIKSSSFILYNQLDMFALVESFITGSVTDALGELSSLGKESSTTKTVKQILLDSILNKKLS